MCGRNCCWGRQRMSPQHLFTEHLLCARFRSEQDRLGVASSAGGGPCLAAVPVLL